MNPNEIDLKLLRYLQLVEGYEYVLPCGNRGYAGLQRMLFGDYDICYGLTWHGLEGRYRYNNEMEAITALLSWNGDGDPPGNWVYHVWRGITVKNFVQ